MKTFLRNMCSFSVHIRTLWLQQVDNNLVLITYYFVDVYFLFTDKVTKKKVSVLVFRFPDHHKDFLGHRMNIVLMPYFPYISYRVEQNASATTVHLEDSLNTRMVTTLAHHMNFT